MDRGSWNLEQALTGPKACFLFEVGHGTRALLFCHPEVSFRIQKTNSKTKKTVIANGCTSWEEVVERNVAISDVGNRQNEIARLDLPRFGEADLCQSRQASSQSLLAMTVFSF